MSRLAQFEALAERLVEGTFARLFAGRLRPLEVATHLARALEDQQVQPHDGGPQAPTHYWVYLNPDDCDALAIEQPDLESELTTYVARLASQAGLLLEVRPVIRILPDAKVAPHQIHVEARWMPGEAARLERTHELAPVDADVEAAASMPPQGRPFLIIEGKRHIDLTEPVISIGRSVDNAIIIEDPRVSRQHAQLRRRFGRYVLYDLGSSGGTTINGYPVEECVLHSGDVISLAGVDVIFGEDPPSALLLPDSEDTPALPAEQKPGLD